MDYMNENYGNTMFPIFLKLHELRLLLIGGGNVGLEKLEAILKNAPLANVLIVAKEIRRREILELVEDHPNVTLSIRQYEDADLKNRDLVICATDSRSLHEQVKKKAKAMNLLVNVADTPDLCDFYLCSVVKRGDLKIGISTNGKSPTLAKRMRQYLSTALPETNEVQTLLDNLKAVRDQLGGDFDFKVKQLNEITASWLDENKEKPL